MSTQNQQRHLAADQRDHPRWRLILTWMGRKPVTLSCIYALPKQELPVEANIGLLIPSAVQSWVESKFSNVILEGEV